jgi:prevent-host-death family protein
MPTSDTRKRRVTKKVQGHKMATAVPPLRPPKGAASKPLAAPGPYKVALSVAKKDFSALVDRVRIEGQHVFISKHSKDAAVLIGAGEFKRLQMLEDTLRTVQLRQALDGPMKPLEQVLAEIDLGL